MARAMVERAVSAGGHTFNAVLNVTAAGRGLDPDNSVVLLHGFPQSKASWSAVLAGLDTAGVSAVAFDQRGYSPYARPLDAADYRLEHLVADVVGVCDVLGLRTVHLVGHDWGALVAWAVAAGHPELLRSLVAVSVPHPAAFDWAKINDDDQRARSDYMDFLRYDVNAAHAMTADRGAAMRAGFSGAIDAATVEQHLDVLLAPGAMDAALNWYRAAEGHSEVGRVTVPTTLLWDSADIAVGRAGVQRCAGFVDAEYRLVELTGTSHWIPEHRPGAVIETVLSHIGIGMLGVGR